ncbi:hypothetical protein DW766_01475 [Butyricicoccus sp. AM29-23AC]|jgi:hypothetical protein|nr:hypothetical protein DW766_01475 [Butyricicoccus sp. AM29-23AC]DAV60685.1 MAG TPA: hypothetical protein [Caudoviricetes sp.]DAZ46912.1 MAG TPA: hypothetical protein [Caudoviricetes sp.]
MVALDDLGIRYEEITDFQLFMMLTRQLTPDDTSILLGDLNLSEYEPQINATDGTVRLYNRKNQTIIDEAIYQQIVQFLRRMHDIKRKVIITKTEHDREYMISKERRAQRYARRKKQEKSSLFPIVSALCNHEGFKYNSDTVWNVRVFVFYDSLKRIQKLTEARQLAAALYAGTIEKKSISDDALNWLGSLE